MNSSESVNNTIMLILQLIPFILICYFLLYSLLYNSMSGLMVIVGLIVSMTITTLFINTLHTGDSKSISNLCGMINIPGVSSRVPFSQTIYCFIFAYLLFTTLLYNQGIRNILSFVCFALLILVDMYRLISHDCFPMYNILFTVVIGLIFGILWGRIINASDNKSIQYVIGHHELCEMPISRSFKCRA
jgi:hypothetical protein